MLKQRGEDRKQSKGGVVDDLSDTSRLLPAVSELAKLEVFLSLLQIFSSTVKEGPQCCLHWLQTSLHYCPGIKGEKVFQVEASEIVIIMSWIYQALFVIPLVVIYIVPINYSQQNRNLAVLRYMCNYIKLRDTLSKVSATNSALTNRQHSLTFIQGNVGTGLTWQTHVKQDFYYQLFSFCSAFTSQVCSQNPKKLIYSIIIHIRTKIRYCPQKFFFYNKILFYLLIKLLFFYAKDHYIRFDKAHLP